MPDPTDRPAPARSLILVMSLACGVGVANVYFPQAITPLLAPELGISEGAATAVATIVQLGYAAGIFLLVPLGDRLARRPLIVTMLGIVGAGLVLVGCASTLPLIYAFSVIVGSATVVPQILIPMAADLTDTRHAGQVVGVLQGGLLGGVLLARAFGGAIGQMLGWRAPYLIAGVLAALLAAVLAVILPTTRASSRDSYPALLARSLQLLRTQPDLRRSSLYQFLSFGGFTAAWTSIALLLTSPTFGYGTGVVGIVALVGAASVFAVPAAGRLIDRHGPDAVNLVCFGGIVLAAAVLLTGLLHGPAALLGLMTGMLLLDVSVQTSQVANQARIFALVPGARSRLNSAYMTAVFLGGTAGSWAGAHLYVAIGWPAVCALIAGAGLLAVLRHIVRPKPAAPVHAPAPPAPAGTIGN